MKIRYALLAIALGMLSACATPGTSVNSNSEAFKGMARSQQGWCSQFGCDCKLDGQPATCSLVATCVNTGGCAKM